MFRSPFAANRVCGNQQRIAGEKNPIISPVSVKTIKNKIKYPPQRYEVRNRIKHMKKYFMVSIIVFLLFIPQQHLDHRRIHRY